MEYMGRALGTYRDFQFWMCIKNLVVMRRHNISGGSIGVEVFEFYS